METIGTKLRAIQARSGLSYDQIAQAAGYKGKSSVQAYFSPDYDGPLSPSVCAKLAKGFASAPIDPADLWELADVPIQPNAVLANLPPDEGQTPRDIPVYGTALGAPLNFDSVAIEQTTLDQSEVIMYFSRPTSLTRRRGVYGVFVQGSSMSPRFQEGETALVDPTRPPQIGDDVLVFLRSPDDEGERMTCCLIKRLVRRTAEYIELEQFTPATTFRVDREKVARVHRVIPWSELLA